MLQRLLIKNIVLIESSEIFFQPGFNVLTGETGAGKSMVLAAIHLLLGQRHDSSLIRQGETSASVEASFDISNESTIFSLLEEAGIDHSRHDALIVKRNLLQTGKSRTYINNHLVQLSFLKKLGPHLIELCAQHTHIQLLEEEQPLHLLDTFADLHECKTQFQKAHAHCLTIKKNIREFKQNQLTRERLIEVCQREIEEIKKAKLIDGEEEELFNQFTTLTDNLQLSATIQEVSSELDSEHNSLILQLFRLKPKFEQLSLLKPEFQSMYETYCRSTTELKDITYELTKLSSRYDVPIHEIAKTETRLQVIHALKRKYGSTIGEILEWKSRQEKTLHELQLQDVSLEELENSLAQVQQEADDYARTLSNERQKAANHLATLVTEEIQLLNMANAIFEITLNRRERGPLGDESIQFFLTPNRGEIRVDVQQASSGGELSRIALALQSILSNKRPHITIIFDEIDANIGGETASIVGRNFASMAKDRQVIAITHFPQVALYADTHFQITKAEKNERTCSTILHLENSEQQQLELTRMLGGESIDLLNTSGSLIETFMECRQK